MHNVRRGCKKLPLIMNRGSATDAYPRRSSTTIQGTDLSDRRTIMRPVDATLQTFAGGNESSHLSLSHEYEMRDSLPFEDFPGDPARPQATVMEVISSSTEARFDPNTFSHDATTNLGDSIVSHTVASMLTDSNAEFNPTNWLLDDSFANIFDDCGMNPNWFEPQSFYESSQLTSAALTSARSGTKSPTILDLRQLWYIQVRDSIKDLDDHCKSSVKHLTTTLRPDIDEVYRTNIANELLTQPHNEPLPSIEFLVFWPLLPCV